MKYLKTEKKSKQQQKAFTSSILTKNHYIIFYQMAYSYINIHIAKIFYVVKYQPYKIHGFFFIVKRCFFKVTVRTNISKTQP